MQQKLQAKMEPIMKAVQGKDFKGAVSQIDKIMASDPESKPALSEFKLAVMVEGKLPGLGDYLTSLGKESFTNDPMALNQIIWTVVENDLKLEPGAYKAAVALGKKMMAMDPKNPMNMDTYALALWRAGDKAKALATQKTAVELASKDKEVPAETVTELKGRLKLYGG